MHIRSLTPYRYSLRCVLDMTATPETLEAKAGGLVPVRDEKDALEFDVDEKGDAVAAALAKGPPAWSKV